MPHLVLEYSANLPDQPDLDALLLRLHESLSRGGLFELEKIKSRAVRHSTFRVADGAADRAFVHLTAAVLEGREREVLRGAAESLLAVLCQAFPRSRCERRCDVTVEVREMRRPLYLKAEAAP
ncbi:MAG TPA: 5-carboxymethyl-2-hydroxymuconate Delta-isomerase [Vicinamibacteria bacterium]|nr:5-carboxymethyl-2-hydroxymuconate Delta-isomerase [Vicinamibacteria bacterium]